VKPGREDDVSLDVLKIAVLVVVPIATTGNSAAAADLTGIGGQVVDGDEFTLCHLGGCQRIRLCGIDTPSKGHPAYLATITALADLVMNQEVICRVVGNGSVCDGYSASTSRGRIVAQCFIKGPTTSIDVAAALVETGFACDRVSSSGGYYSTDHPERECSP
jgi:endonuclease YncB( thermonuclease family)